MTSSSRPETLPPRAFETLRGHGFELGEVAPLAGDVSLRRYYRVSLSDGSGAILAAYPPQIAATCQRFARTSALLGTYGIPHPKVLLSLCDEGLMLLEDLGERTLFDLRHRPWVALEPFLRHAATLSSSIAAIPTTLARDLNPPLDGELLSAELARTWELLLGDESVVPRALSTSLAGAFDDMVDQLSSARQATCHRDFMARNLIPVGNSPALAVIDHQDLRIGPAVYDLASLLNDSLFPPEDLEMELAAPRLDSAGERLDYHRAASQRTLKAVGTFVAFARRGDARHTLLVPPTLARARRHLHHLPEMDSFGRQIDALWAELLAALPDEGSAR